MNRKLFKPDNLGSGKKGGLKGVTRMVKKKLEFQPTTPVPALEEDTAAASRDVWLATWGIVAIFVIVILVLFFTGKLGAMTGAGVTLVPEQNACLRGNAVTDIQYANRMVSMGYVCQQGLLPYVKCCWRP
jgi:hypothetical protein